MYKYAEIYGGVVRDIKESNLEFVDFCSIFSPLNFWIDVTGVEEIGVGWVVKSNSIVGTYFEKPEEIGEITLDKLKLAKKEMLQLYFNNVQEDAFLISSLGFRVNAGQRAYRDVDGLITQMELENTDYVDFRDYDNVFQSITLEEARVLKLEIIKNGQYVYSQKWEKEALIENAENEEQLNEINIAFEMLDFFNL